MVHARTRKRNTIAVVVRFDQVLVLLILPRGRETLLMRPIVELEDDERGERRVHFRLDPE